MTAKLNPITIARARGYVVRPEGFQGTNDAWLCGHCGRISKSMETVFKSHRGCKAQYALALIMEEKADGRCEPGCNRFS
jgi:hypothetical protein